MRGDFRLGEWTVSPRRECILRGDISVRIHPKPMAVLVCLARSGGEVVTRRELFDSVWPGVIVTDDALTQCIVELRKAFGDSAREQKIIRTVPKVGFCLALPVRKPDAGTQPSIAVLPFLNMSADPEQEYFSDGISEELINLLAKTPGLKVISQTSAFSFKNRKLDVPTIAQKLGVSHVLEGSVRWSASRTRVTAQLVEARSDSHIWSQTYDRDFSEIFAIQDEIAQNVVDEVKVTLFGARPRSVQVSPEAYRLYLLGRYHLHNWEASRARSNFREAIKTDPRFAQAHLAIAICYALETFTGFLSPREGYSKIEAEIESALQSDGNLPEIHRTVAEMEFYYKWNWQAAESAFLRAISEVPSDAHAHQLYAWFLAAMARTDEAMAIIRRGLELEPLSAAMYLTASNVCYLAGLYDQAISQCEKALEHSPDNPLVLAEIAWSQLQVGRFDETIDRLERSVRMEPGNMQHLWSLGHAYGVAGMAGKAEGVLQRLHDMAGERYVLPFGIALVHAGLGQADRAIDWLEKAYDERNGWMVYLRVEPRLDPLRSHPRFRALLGRMNFPG